MVVNADRLESTRHFSQFKGLDDTTKTVERAAPEIRVDILVRHRRVDLLITPLANADRRDGGERRIAAGDLRVAAVHVEETGRGRDPEGLDARRGVAAPEQ